MEKSELKLILPNYRYLEDYALYYKEYLDNNLSCEHIVTESQGHIEKMENERNGIGLPKGYVPHTELWCVEGNTIVGIIDIRHRLNNFLLNYGGNIGYEIRPSKRHQGYGTKMLNLALNYCKNELNLKKVLITCDETNAASKKVIESNGGIFAKQLRNSFLDVDTLCYWITLDSKIIETERLILRETNETDFDNLASVISDPINMKFYPAPYNENGVKRWLDWCMNLYKTNGFGLWAIELKDNGEYIGDCGLTMQNIDGEIVPEIGYHLKLNQHKKGYAIEAARAVKDYIFEKYDFDALYSYMTKANVDSSLLAERNGMKFIKEYIEDGVPHKVYRITRRMWEEDRSK